MTLLRDLGGARRDQLVKLLAREEVTPERLDAMLRQLLHGGFITAPSPKVVCASGLDPPAETFLEAVDVMLEITNGRVLACEAGRDPVLLRFFSDGETPRCFLVASGSSPRIMLPLELLPGQRAIVMLWENDADLRARLPSSHFVAVAAPGGGAHRFFRCGGR